MNSALPPAQILPSGALSCLSAIFIFFAVAIPTYLVMRSLVRLTRIRYGFEMPQADDGPPIRVCDRCSNTVLEPDYQHCPYCGAPLGPPISHDAKPPAGDAGVQPDRRGTGAEDEA